LFVQKGFGEIAEGELEPALMKKASQKNALKKFSGFFRLFCVVHLLLLEKICRRDERKSRNDCIILDEKFIDFHLL
jgi:hypothetical protein